MAEYKLSRVPTGGERIEASDGVFKVPDRPISDTVIAGTRS